MTSARDKERISALTAGLAATIILWTFAAGYAPAALATLGDYSPWLYGPFVTVAWAVFSLITYLLIHRRRPQRKLSLPCDEAYRCPEFGVTLAASRGSVCANRDEKNHLAAVTAGFAFTISAWVAALSLMPTDLFDSLSTAPPWSYCVGSVGFWAISSSIMYSIFSAGDRRHYGGKSPDV